MASLSRLSHNLGGGKSSTVSINFGPEVQTKGIVGVDASSASRTCLHGKALRHIGLHVLPLLLQ